VIKGFKSRATETLFKGGKPAKYLRPIAKIAMRKLDMVDYAQALSDFRAPPGNRLEALKGKRRGQYRIRINDQLRVCFVWREGERDDVEIVDYH